jgi:hypothetical protein
LANFHTLLNIQVTKEIQEKIRDALTSKLQSLRSTSSDAVYLASIEKFLLTYFSSEENQVLFQLKANTIPNVTIED